MGMAVFHYVEGMQDMQLINVFMSHMTSNLDNAYTS